MSYKVIFTNAYEKKRSELVKRVDVLCTAGVINENSDLVR